MTEFTLSPAFDGVTTTFTVSAAFQLGTGHVYVNGARKTVDDSQWALTENSTTSITLGTAPTSNDVIIFEAESFTSGTASATDPGYRGVQEVRYGTTSQKLTCWCDVNGVQSNPDAGATVEVYKRGDADGSPTITSTAATEDGTSHQLSYMLNASSTSVWPLGTGNWAKWTYVVGGVTYVTVTTFEVVRQPLVSNCPVVQEDILKGHQAIAEALSQEGETAATVAQKYINMAWADVLSWVRSKGKRPALTTGKEALERVTYYRTMVLLYRAHRESGSDTWATALEDAKKDYETAQKECVLEYREADSVSPVTERGFQQPQLLVGNDLRANGAGIFGLRGQWVGGRWP